MSHNEFKTSEPTELQEASPMEKKLSVVGSVTNYCADTYHSRRCRTKFAEGHTVQVLLAEQLCFATC